jgi:hypothetical protein
MRISTTTAIDAVNTVTNNLNQYIDLGLETITLGSCFDPVDTSSSEVALMQLHYDVRDHFMDYLPEIDAHIAATAVCREAIINSFSEHTYLGVYGESIYGPYTEEELSDRTGDECDVIYRIPIALEEDFRRYVEENLNGADCAVLEFGDAVSYL